MPRADMPGGRRALIGAAILVGTALLLRLVAARGPLWLDEVLSLGLSISAERASDIVLRLRHDNNHVLNTLWLRLLGETSAPLLLRLPGVLAGTAAVALMAAWRWRSPREGLIAAALAALALPLVQCGSEARGYGLALGATLAAVVLAPRAERSAGWAAPAAYWVLALAGMLAHLSFMMIIASLALSGTLARAARPAALARVHAVPALLALAAWWGVARDMTIAGGPDPSFPPSLAALSLLGAGPGSGVAAVLVATVMLASLLAGIAALARDDSRDALTVLLGALVLPAAVVLVLRPDYLVARYFLLSMPLALAAIAALVERGLRGGTLPRAAALAGLAALLAGSAARDAQLLRTGRGDFAQVIAVLRSRPDLDREQIRVAASSDFRAQVMLWSQRRQASEAPAIALVTASSARQAPPRWFLLESFEPGAPLPEWVRLRGSSAPGQLPPRHVLRAVVPHAGMTGMTWGVYERADR